MTMIHIPGTNTMSPEQATARIQNLENALGLVLFLHIRDDDPAADPTTQVKTGDLWVAAS